MIRERARKHITIVKQIRMEDILRYESLTESEIDREIAAILRSHGLEPKTEYIEDVKKYVKEKLYEKLKSRNLHVTEELVNELLKFVIHYAYLIYRV